MNPPPSLTDPEIEHVFEILRTLKKQNVGIVFISHKLREVMEICDRYTPCCATASWCRKATSGM